MLLSLSIVYMYVMWIAVVLVNYIVVYRSTTNQEVNLLTENLAVKNISQASYKLLIHTQNRVLYTYVQWLLQQ